MCSLRSLRTSVHDRLDRKRMQKLKPFMSAKHKKRRRGDATPEASTARGAVRCEFYADDEEAVRYTATGRQTLVQQV